jgi:hypothetical protein
MPCAKDIRVAPISSADARRVIERYHYSGKCVNNSQLHFGVFLNDKLLGAMQFGPPMDKRRMLPLVEGTKWNGMLELNRMAFADALPRNSESRAIAIALRMIRKNYPHIEWVVSFADGTQCGDGTIYRASGFVLTQVKKNGTLWQSPEGDVVADITLKTGAHLTGKPQVISKMTLTKHKHLAATNGKASMTRYREIGYTPLEGFQLRYVYFLNPNARERLTCSVLPFSTIEKLGAKMYRGERARSTDSGAADDQSAGSGANPTRALDALGDCDTPLNAHN